MGRNRFVNTNPATRETVKVELSDGDFVLFKRSLSNQERRHVSMAGFGAIKGDIGSGNGELNIDWEAMETERVYTWLNGWSFEDAEGNKVQFNRKNVELLDPATFEEIKAKLDEHVGEVEKNESSSEPTRRLKRVGAGSTAEQ